MSDRATSRPRPVGRADGAPGAALLRLLLVLAAVLGVVGMHGLTSGHGHHGAASVDRGAHVAVAGTTAGHDGHAAAAVVGAVVAGDDVRSSGESPAGGTADVLLHLCLAVVTAGAVALAAVVASRSRRRPPRAWCPARAVLRVPVVPPLTAPPWTHLSRAQLCLWRV
ncbi:hypothetical protein WDZ16_09645 [Pseudokineococcus marinus]|uniref:Uncharacterized protein n=1 Tax=Pseudokineococcus marinus TaxID=351215 RepID=A0A849BTI3_9ACTN|nr:hypothetical protein [Pseudokineococcus marinus]NNH22836.1 hypothetical protein [Pseudokineococcus marinus]